MKFFEVKFCIDCEDDNTPFQFDSVMSEALETMFARYDKSIDVHDVIVEEVKQ
ncbi:MAG: hypothetical protein NC324_09740 [Bacteroides sp.]|nr:hypothetical protein [Bacteroides sp.]